MTAEGNGAKWGLSCLFRTDDELQDIYTYIMDTDFDLRSLFSVEGLVVVITGGGTGIGLMVCFLFRRKEL
jgi:hypothetical protein